MPRRKIVKKTRSERRGERLEERQGKVSPALRRGKGMAAEERKDVRKNVYNPLKAQRKQDKLVRKATAAGASITGQYKTELGPPRDESKKSGRQYKRVVGAMKKYQAELAKMGAQPEERTQKEKKRRGGGVRLPKGGTQRRRRTRRAS